MENNNQKNDEISADEKEQELKEIYKQKVKR